MRIYADGKSLFIYSLTNIKQGRLDAYASVFDEVENYYFVIRDL